MTATPVTQPEVSRPMRAAHGLVEHLETGKALPCLVGRQMADGEPVHVDVPANAWWFGSVEATYEEGGFLDPTSLFAYTLTASITTVSIEQRRAHAEAMARPQWHRLGTRTTEVILTSEQTIISYDDQVLTLMHGRGLEVSADIRHQCLYMTPEETAPLCLTGQWVPYLWVAMLYSLHGEIADLSGLIDPSDGGVNLLASAP